jgi:hypothetical protein
VLTWQEDCKGNTQAWKVDSFDHLDGFGMPRSFALKYFRDGDEQTRIVEFLCASLAHELEVGAPEVAVLNVTPEFLDSLKLLTTAPRGLARAVPGEHVGIAWVEGAAELARYPGALTGLADRRQPAEIIGCDALVQNDDRHDGNVLLHPGGIFGRADHKLIPIDWGGGLLSLDPAQVLGRRLSRDTGLRRVAMASSLRNVVRGSEDFAHLIQRLEDLVAAPTRLQGIIQRIPDSWSVTDDTKAAFLDYFVQRLHLLIVRLGRGDDPEGIFPNWQPTLLL